MNILFDVTLSLFKSVPNEKFRNGLSDLIYDAKDLPHSAVDFCYQRDYFVFLNIRKQFILPFLLFLSSHVSRR